MFGWIKIFRIGNIPTCFRKAIYGKKTATTHASVKMVDVLVDGPYVDAQRDVTTKWRGSKNQRVINIPETLKQQKVVLYCD